MFWKELTLGILGFILYRIWKIRHTFQSIDLPTPKQYSLIFGHFKLMDPHVSLQMYQKEMKGIKTFKLRNIFLNTLLSYDVAFIKEVLAIRNLPKSHTYDEIERWWGKGNILTAQHDNTNWKEHRHLLNPVFRTAAIRKLRATFEKHADKLVQKLGEINGNVEFSDIIQKTTLDIIADAGFGYDLGALDDKSSEFLTTLKEMISLLGSPWVLIPFGGYIIKWSNIKKRKAVDDIIDQVISSRLKNKENTKETHDILDMMLQASDSYDPVALRSDLFTFFVAGHETSASSLSFLLYEMAKNPETQDAAYQEVESVLQGSKPSPELDLMASMPYLMACLNEGLRLYPISGGVTRTVHEDTIIQGIHITKGTQLELNFSMCQRDPDIWTNPDQFDPSRFNGKNPNPNEFFPFSAGPRICIGKNFFYEESLVILSSILQKYTFTLEDTESGVANALTGLLKPNKVILKFHKRE